MMSLTALLLGVILGLKLSESKSVRRSLPEVRKVLRDYMKSQ